MSLIRIFVIFALSFITSACLGYPEGVHPVREFDLNKYLGKWYEIARLDHSFERGLDRVSAEYSLRDDGGVRVINKGFSVKENKWKESEGKAYFVRGQDEGYLKVSFFGPFYGSYVVFELDKEDYQYAFISGNNTSYLWLLARSPSISREVVDRFVKRSGEIGFNTDDLIFVKHD